MNKRYLLLHFVHLRTSDNSDTMVIENYIIVSVKGKIIHWLGVVFLNFICVIICIVMHYNFCDCLQVTFQNLD